MEPALTPGIERETALNMSHLRAEMARIDALLARAVARGQAAGKGTLDPFRGLHVTDAESTRSVVSCRWTAGTGQRA